MSSEQALTNTVGYYNGSGHPMQLMVTKLNVTLILQSNQYILDRQGRKINDPYFDHYLAGGLKKETSEQPVPLIAIPHVEPPVPRTSNYSVRGTQDVNPTREAPAVPEVVTPAGAPTISQSSHRGMSVDEARRQGLIKRTREVPEDYGTPDTDTGLPPKPSEIKYAVDTVRSRKTELPAELVQEAQQNVKAQPLVTQLQKASAAPAIAEGTGFMNEVIHNVPPEESPLQAGIPSEPASRAKEAVSEVVEESAQVERIAELPEPKLDDEITPMDPEAEEDLGPDPEDEVDEGEDEDEDDTEAGEEDEEEALKAPVRRYKRPATKTRFTCPIEGCGKPHKFRSQLVQHAQQSHPDQVDAILSKFPVK